MVVDLATGLADEIARGPEFCAVSLAAAADGTLYLMRRPALHARGSDVMTVDPATGATAVIGSLKLRLHVGEAAFAPTGELMLYSSLFSDRCEPGEILGPPACLFRVDLSSLSTQLVGRQTASVAGSPLVATATRS
ncbi:MAG: hypothetical protein ACRDWD_17165 [Acidimicrobiia bacterium]